jgi:hypothetical protein
MIERNVGFANLNLKLSNQIPEGGRILKVEQDSYIRTAHRVYGKKIKQLSRETEHSKNAIKKLVEARD